MARFLLVAGALLVVIAAAVFTVANWSSIGAFGRCAVLLGVTVIVLAAPRLLTRRDLGATAEAVAGVGLALTLADAYLVGRLLNAPGSALTAAAGCAALAGIWAGYGRITRLRVPAIAAIGLAQVPALYATAASTRSLGAFAIVLVTTAGMDLLLARTLARRGLRPETLTSSVLAAVAWATAICLVLPRATQALTGISTGAVEARLAVVTLGLAALVCLVSPAAIDRTLARAVALGLAVLAVGSGPAALGATGWARTGILDAGVAALIGLAAAQTAAQAAAQTGALARAERRLQSGLVITAGLGAVVPAISAAVTGPTGSAAPVAECAILGLIFGLAAAFARNLPAAAISTGAALAAATGLAFAASAAARIPAAASGFAVLAVAVLAIVGSTLLRNKRPVHGLVLDAGAGVVMIIAAVTAAPQKDTFALVAAVIAILASSTAWVRGGARRMVALVGAAIAVLAAVGVQWQPLGHAWFGGYRAWDGHPLTGTAATAATAGSGLPFAAGVLALGLAAVVTAAGAWRGDRRGSLDALAIVLPVVAVPGALAGGLSYPIVLACLLALALGLTTWAAIDGSLAPASAAIVATIVALAWALATPAATLITLGGLTVCYLTTAWRTTARIATAALAVLATAALAAATALAAGQPIGQPAWLAGICALGVAAIAHLAAARLTARLPLTAKSVELAAWTTAVIGTTLCLTHPKTASLAFAILGLQLLGTSLRQDRRPAFWIGLAALEIAWCLLLITLRVTTIEAYTVPAAAILIVWPIRAAARNSWVLSPGLALLVLPSLIVAWQTHGWIRPTLLGLAAAAVTLIGARRKLQAPLLIGAAVAVLDAGDQLAPDVRRLTELLPGWIPIALIGAALLWAGATYEARVRNLASLRRTLAELH